MTNEEQEKRLTELFTQISNIQTKKGNDYAGQTDRLGNFKRAGAICGLTPEQQCLSLIATKVARLGTLLNSDLPPANESISDSVLDLISYSILLDMLLEDKHAEPTHQAAVSK